MALANRCGRSCISLATTRMSRSSVLRVPSGASFSTQPTSFFTFNSGRSRRRRRRDVRNKNRATARKETKASIDSAPLVKADKRSIRDILLPQPFKNSSQLDDDKIIWPTSVSMWRRTLSQAWATYLTSWDGFFTSQGFIVQSKEERQLQLNIKDAELAVENKRDEVTANVKRNVDFVKEESTRLRNEVRERTGIHTVEDLRRIAGDLMKLASNCVKEFMVGYRKGRDDETEKMLTLYFQDLDDKVNKPKRRKAKRRILKP